MPRRSSTPPLKLVPPPAGTPDVAVAGAAEAASPATAPGADSSPAAVPPARPARGGARAAAPAKPATSTAPPANGKSAGPAADAAKPARRAADGAKSAARSPGSRTRRDAGGVAGAAQAALPIDPAPLPQVDAEPPSRKSAQIAAISALPPVTIPPEALASPPGNGLFAKALAISLAVHLVALAIHFSPIDLDRFKDKSPPLEVALVNAKSKAKPTKADILAQAHLDGGGNTDADRRAKTPLPVLPQDSPARDIAVASQRIEAQEQKVQELLTKLKSVPVAAPKPQAQDAPEKTESPTANELMQRTLEAMRLEAQIAKDMDAYQKRPKRRFIGARAEEYRFARYVEDWRLKIERIGNLNYPQAARQQKLYGSLVLTVSIKADGSIENVEVSKSSGKRILDAAAVKIVEMAAPYAAFPPDIKRDTDVIHITRTWTFTKGDELVSN